MMKMENSLMGKYQSNFKWQALLIDAKLSG